MGTITFPVPFTSLNYAVVTGGAGDGGFNDQDNYPTWNKGSKTLTQVSWRNPDDDVAELDWMARGW
ncbi:hypothetical protein HUV48_00455 [Altererythrobacter sp. HHU K3-1]|uniref:Putative tail fiber protein gp53-like C-terminal domain-containing protein n=1 Tax=Qipengyuania atrilutea TaxID=2744473 RepID=A0A850GYC0_9SPHN|nr:hypothetical protein [Actirhodobacter atriluteus]NVD43486.1 hypothetical protein [Actirhodobacter atriluteus]